MYCLQATRARGRVLSNSVGPALSDTAKKGNNDRNQHNNNKEGIVVPLSQIHSWQAPVDWHSSFAASGELESFQSQNAKKPNQPFSDFARTVSFTKELQETTAAESTSSETEPSDLVKSSLPSSKPTPPKFHIRVTTESEVSVEEGGELERRFTPKI